MLAQDLGELVDQSLRALVGQPEQPPLGLGHYEVDPGLGKPPQVGEVGFQLAARIPLRPQVGQAQVPEFQKVIGIERHYQVEIVHQLRGYSTCAATDSAI